MFILPALNPNKETYVGIYVTSNTESTGQYVDDLFLIQNPTQEEKESLFQNRSNDLSQSINLHGMRQRTNRPTIRFSNHQIYLLKFFGA